MPTPTPIIITTGSTNMNATAYFQNRMNAKPVPKPQRRDAPIADSRDRLQLGPRLVQKYGFSTHSSLNSLPVSTRNTSSKCAGRYVTRISTMPVSVETSGFVPRGAVTSTRGPYLAVVASFFI